MDTLEYLIIIAWLLLCKFKVGIVYIQKFGSFFLFYPINPLNYWVFSVDLSCLVSISCIPQLWHFSSTCLCPWNFEKSKRLREVGFYEMKLGRILA